MAQTTQAHNNDNVNPSLLYMAMELSNKKWHLLFSGGGKKRKTKLIDARNTVDLMDAITDAKERLGLPISTRVVSCFEAGRDGFWIHRYLETIDVENVVVDSSSIEVSRRGKQIKTDRVDAEKLLSLLLRYHGGDTGVWSVVQVPTPEAEDDKRLHRELERLKKERIGHSNRISSLLVVQGIELTANAELPEQLKEARLWNGECLPPDLLTELLREHERWLLVKTQIRNLEADQKARLQEADTKPLQQIVALAELRGIGHTSAWVFVMEFFGCREFKNRRQLASLAGLTGAPYDSGDLKRDQGITKAGNHRIRKMIVEIAWCWLRYQPGSALSQWFGVRFAKGGRRMRRVGIVALARKLLIALWRYLEQGVIPEGALLKSQAAA